MARDSGNICNRIFKCLCFRDELSNDNPGRAPPQAPAQNQVAAGHIQSQPNQTPAQTSRPQMQPSQSPAVPSQIQSQQPQPNSGMSYDNQVQSNGSRVHSSGSPVRREPETEPFPRLSDADRQNLDPEGETRPRRHTVNELDPKLTNTYQTRGFKPDIREELAITPASPVTGPSSTVTGPSSAVTGPNSASTEQTPSGFGDTRPTTASATNTPIAGLENTAPFDPSKLTFHDHALREEALGYPARGWQSPTRGMIESIEHSGPDMQSATGEMMPSQVRTDLGDFSMIPSALDHYTPEEDRPQSFGENISDIPNWASDTQNSGYPPKRRSSEIMPAAQKLFKSMPSSRPEDLAEESELPVTSPVWLREQLDQRHAREKGKENEPLHPPQQHLETFDGSSEQMVGSSDFPEVPKAEQGDPRPQT
ncbi:MAG: hypothetical protein M1828_003429 [Chrysothrix sp. TS-e1954]|nr:MAG: hypothetical protein M1828_003429 [Chrysothrix sp. TS-e1954]